MPRKQWAAFERVTAADVNANLADQSVMRFASSAARSTAIPAPTEGMVSYLDDVNALQVYDGSAWVAVIGGTVANPLAVGDPLNLKSVVRFGASTGSVWTQLSASMPADSLILGVSVVSDTAPSPGLVSLGTGSAGSEVFRFRSFPTHLTTNTPASSYLHVPYGMFVPAGTRLAFHTEGGLTGSASQISVNYVETSTGTQAQADIVTSSTVTPNSTWVQVAATPPLAGGVWVIGVYYGGARTSAPGSQVRFGTGASGSETAVTGYVNGSRWYYGSGITEPQAYIPPFWWPPSTRLAIQRDATPGADSQAVVFWRESLA
ncbi:hypothetical protein EBZ38_16260 [bacterium]|nr:hypothetical protein [bacterium]